MLEPLNQLRFRQSQIVQDFDERHHHNFVSMRAFANADSSIKEPSNTAFVRNESRENSGVRKIRMSFKSVPCLVACRESSSSEPVGCHDEDVPRHGSEGILVAEVLVAHLNRPLRLNGHVPARD